MKTKLEIKLLMKAANNINFYIAHTPEIQINVLYNTNMHKNNTVIIMLSVLHLLFKSYNFLVIFNSNLLN